MKDQNDNFQGCPVRLYDPAKGGGGFQLSKHNCDLCKSQGVTWLCTGCKRILCVDKDHSKELLSLLQDDSEGPWLRRQCAALADLGRGNVPAYFTEIGKVKGKPVLVGKSCFHLTHPNFFCHPCDMENDDDNDVMNQTDRIAAASINSPTIEARRRSHC